MLNKEATIPGAQIRTRKVLKDGLPGSFRIEGDTGEIPHITAHPSGLGANIGTHAFLVGPEEALTVVEKPRKRGGVNMCKVRNAQGQEGHVFWCELRMSCDHVGDR